jgi:hypothetical protein
MRFITGLRAIKSHLKFVSHTIVLRVLAPHGIGMAPATYEQNLLQAGQVAVWIAELEDHLYYLGLLHTAAQHGQQGTIAFGYDEDGYEGWEEPATPTTPYDAYEDMRLLLSTSSPFGQLGLSSGLLRYIELMPEQRRRTSVQEQDGEILMTTTESGEVRPMTTAEIGRLGDQVFVGAMEELLFVESYAQDLAHLKSLVEQRAGWEQITSLLD